MAIDRSPHLSDWEHIHQKLATFAALIDAKDFSRTRTIFHPTSTVIMPGPGGAPTTLIGAEAVQSAMEAMLPAGIATHHLLGAPVIDLAEDGRTAKTTQSIIASHWATNGDLKGDVLRTYSRNHSDWVKEEGERWVIRNWRLEHAGFFDGNPKIFDQLATAGADQRA